MFRRAPCRQLVRVPRVHGILQHRSIGPPELRTRRVALRTRSAGRRSGPSQERATPGGLWRSRPISSDASIVACGERLVRGRNRRVTRLRFGGTRSGPISSRTGRHPINCIGACVAALGGRMLRPPHRIGILVRPIPVTVIGEPPPLLTQVFAHTQGPAARSTSPTHPRAQHGSSTDPKNIRGGLWSCQGLLLAEVVRASFMRSRTSPTCCPATSNPPRHPVTNPPRPRPGDPEPPGPQRRCRVALMRWSTSRTRSPVACSLVVSRPSAAATRQSRCALETVTVMVSSCTMGWAEMSRV
jgi:hypothetical protein